MIKLMLLLALIPSLTLNYLLTKVMLERQIPEQMLKEAIVKHINPVNVQKQTTARQHQ